MANPMLIVKGAKKGKKLLMPILGAVAGVITISVVASYLQSNLNSNSKDNATDKYLKDNNVNNFNAPLKQSLLSKESNVELDIKTFDILNPIYHLKIKDDIIALKPSKISKIQGELLLDDKLERLDFYNLQSIDNLNNLPDIVKELSFKQSYTLNNNILTITYTLNNNSHNYTLLKNTLTNFNEEAMLMFLALIPNELKFEYNIKQNSFLSNTDNNFLAYKNAYDNELFEYTLSKKFLESIDNSYNGNDIKIASDLDKDAMIKHLTALSKKPNFHIFNNASNYQQIKDSFETTFLNVDNEKLKYVFDLINEPRNNLTENEETELDKIISLDKNSYEYVKHYQRDNSLFYTLPFNIDLKKMLNEDRHPTSYDAIFLYARDIANNKIKHFANTTEPEHSGKGWLEHYYKYYSNETAGAWNGYINFSKYLGIGNSSDVLQAMFYKLYDLKNKWGVNEWRTKDNEATVKEYLKRTMLQFYTMLGHNDIQANFNNPSLEIPSINNEIIKQNDNSTKNTDKPSFYNALIEAYRPFIIGSLLSNQSVETIINEIQKYTLNAYQNALINQVKENYKDLKSLEEYKNDFADYFVNDVLSNPNNNDLTLEGLENKVIEYFKNDKFKPLYIYYNMVNNQNKLKEYISVNKKNNEKSDLYKSILNINKNLDDAFKGFVNKKTNQFSFTDKYSYFAYKDDKVMIINKGVLLDKDISNDTLLLDNFNYSLNSKSATYEYNSYYELARTSFEEIDEKLKTTKNNAFFLYSNNKKAITDLLEMLKFPKHQGSFELIEKQELSFYEYLYNLVYHYHYQTNENKYSGKEILFMIEKYIFKVANTYFASNELDLFNKQLYKNNTVNENEELIKDSEYLKVILNGLNYKDSDIKDTYYETLKTLYARQDFFYFNLPYSTYNDLINDKDIPTYKQEKLSLKDQKEAVLEEFNKYKSIFNDNNLKPFEIMLDFTDTELRTILYKDLENIYNKNDINTKPLIDKLNNLKNNLQDTYKENVDISVINDYLKILTTDKTKYSKIINNNASFNVKEQKALYLNNGYITAFSEKYKDINSKIYHSNKYLLNLFDTIEVALTKDTITANNNVINQVINKFKTNNTKLDITINGDWDNNTYTPYHYSVYNSGFITENIFKNQSATYNFTNNQWLNKAEHWNGKGFDNAIQFLFSPIYVYWFRQGTKVQGTSIQTIFRNQNEWDALPENVIRDNTAIRYTPNDYFFGYKVYNKDTAILNLAIPWYLDFKNYDDNRNDILNVNIENLTYKIPN